VAGVDDTPWSRLMSVADVANGTDRVLDPKEWLFMNTDLTVSLHRLPVSAWIGVRAEANFGPDGAGLTIGRLCDERGPHRLDEPVAPAPEVRLTAGAGHSCSMMRSRSSSTCRASAPTSSHRTVTRLRKSATLLVLVDGTGMPVAQRPQGVVCGDHPAGRPPRTGRRARPTPAGGGSRRPRPPQRWGKVPPRTPCPRPAGSFPWPIEVRFSMNSCRAASVAAAKLLSSEVLTVPPPAGRRTGYAAWHRRIRRPGWCPRPREGPRCRPRP
jgi:hypothetical protein